MNSSNFKIPLTWYPRVNLMRLRGTDMFPPPEDWANLASLCLGTKTRTIGDALMLSSLPRRLKSLYPRLRITTHVRGYNPEVFAHNPFVDGISYLPSRVYGDDACAGSGHHIQVKEHYFGLEPSPDPRPEIWLTKREKEWGCRSMAMVGGPDRAELPVVLLHAWGHTWRHTASAGFWEAMIAEFKTRFRFVQIGISGQARLVGVDEAFLMRPTLGDVRKMFSLVAAAGCFVGINSGPMHVCRAFGIRSLILMENGEPDEIFAKRRYPYYLYNNHVHGFLYQANTHIYAPGKRLEILVRLAGDFLDLNRQS